MCFFCFLNFHYVLLFTWIAHHAFFYRYTFTAVGYSVCVVLIWNFNQSAPGTCLPSVQRKTLVIDKHSTCGTLQNRLIRSSDVGNVMKGVCVASLSRIVYNCILSMQVYFVYGKQRSLSVFVRISYTFSSLIRCS